MPFDSDLPADLLDQALGELCAVDPADRAEALRQLVVDHPGHEAALRELARSLMRTDSLLSRGFAAEPRDPERIGPYRIDRRLGEGAFGVVYLCTQQAPLRREVAVKVLRPGAGDRHTLTRFDLERQMLVGLQHPNIATILDAGALPDGRPFFALEYVAGLPITKHCDEHRLSLEARLRLFVALCGGVQHAHQRGVIHRDLKPANVLVALRDGQSVPKIIDFGIAKAVHGAAVRAAPLTITGRVVGTPGYMSPEQAAGEIASIDTRSDVFALGVMLFELLAGTLPWPAGTTGGGEPPRPSVRLLRDARRTEMLATLRGCAPGPLIKRLRGDLDWIVLKALRSEPELRYQSAKDLADDVERCLRGEAVLAGPPSVSYRLRKFARRHTLALVAAAVMLLSLVGGLVVSLWFYRAADQRAVDLAAALRREQHARAVASEAFDGALMALGAVDALVLRTVEDKHTDVAQATATSQDRLAKTFDHYLDVLRRHAGDPRLHLEMQRVRVALAKLCVRMKQPAQARALAQGLIDELGVASLPEDAGQRAAQLERLGTAWFVLATLDLDAAPDAALGSMQRAVAALEEAQAALPQQPIRSLLEAYATLGFLARDDVDAAQTVMQKLDRHAELVLAAHPHDEGLLVNALTWRAKVVALVSLHDPQRVDDALRRLMVDSRGLLRGELASPAAAGRMAEAWGMLALGQSDRPHMAYAAKACAVDLQRRAASAGDPIARRQLVSLAQQAAHAALAVGCIESARALATDAVAYAQALHRAEPERNDDRVALAQAQLAQAHAQLARGQIGAAAAEQACQQAVSTLAALPALPAARRAAAAALTLRARARECAGCGAQEAWQEAAAAWADVQRRWPGSSADQHAALGGALGLARAALSAGDPAAARRQLDPIGADVRGRAESAARLELDRLLGHVAARAGDVAGLSAIARRLDQQALASRAVAAELWFLVWRSSAEASARADAADCAQALLDGVLWSLQLGEGEPAERALHGPALAMSAQLASARGERALARAQAAAALRAWSTEAPCAPIGDPELWVATRVCAGQ